MRQLRGLPERSPAHTYAGFGIAVGAICVNSKDVVSFAGPPICFRAGGTVVRAVPNWTFRRLRAKRSWSARLERRGLFAARALLDCL